jgi:very-short-patch-repair endonuclease
MVRYERPPVATKYARRMRRDQTDAERKLWFLLRDRRLAESKFRRQAPVGPYIADFVCHRRKLIVEADGAQHMDSASDTQRDRWLSNEGYVVVCYSNIDILKNPVGVLTDLVDRLRERPLYYGPTPSPGRGSLRSPRPPSPPEGRG